MLHDLQMGICIINLEIEEKFEDQRKDGPISCEPLNTGRSGFTVGKIESRKK
jgi:hypothetical protein